MHLEKESELATQLAPLVCVRHDHVLDEETKPPILRQIRLFQSVSEGDQTRMPECSGTSCLRREMFWHLLEDSIELRHAFCGIPSPEGATIYMYLPQRKRLEEVGKFSGEVWERWEAGGLWALEMVLHALVKHA